MHREPPVKHMAQPSVPVGRSTLRSRSLGTCDLQQERTKPPVVRNDWEWPEWCLDPKQPCIEVFVEDEDTGEKRWVTGEPQNRVIDTMDKDLFLCAEYEWNGEFYNQDFEPQHVRRRGDTR